MTRTFLPLLLCTLTLSSAYAQDASPEVFVCVNDQGHKEYTNAKANRGCKRVDLPGITTIPATPSRPSSGPARSSVSTPSDFPKVDSGTQKVRDNDRRQILQEEMRTEEEKLAALKREFNNGEPERRGDERNYAKYQERVGQMREDIARTEKNVEALRRELINQK